MIDLNNCHRGVLVLSTTTLACVLTAIAGGWIFVNLAGKENAYLETERKHVQWEEARKAEQKARQQQASNAGHTSPNLN
jgi:hypothetical protein